MEESRLRPIQDHWPKSRFTFVRTLVKRKLWDFQNDLGDFLGWRRCDAHRLWENSLSSNMAAHLSKLCSFRNSTVWQMWKPSTRKCYLDLISNRRELWTLLSLAQIISEIRRYLDGQRGLKLLSYTMKLGEIAAARSIRTHHNAQNIEMVLPRIATRLHLKHIVGVVWNITEIIVSSVTKGWMPLTASEFTFLSKFTEPMLTLRFIMDLAKLLSAAGRPGWWCQCSQLLRHWDQRSLEPFRSSVVFIIGMLLKEILTDVDSGRYMATNRRLHCCCSWEKGAGLKNIILIWSGAEKQTKTRCA